MEQRYACHVKATRHELYGQKPRFLWGYSVEFIWFDETKDMYRGVLLLEKNGALDTTSYSNEFVIYTAIIDLLTWLSANTSRKDPVAVYVESLRVCNQLGPKRAKLMSSYDYYELAKIARALADTFTDIKPHQVSHESLGRAHLIALKG